MIREVLTVQQKTQNSHLKHKAKTKLDDQIHNSHVADYEHRDKMVSTYQLQCLSLIDKQTWGSRTSMITSNSAFLFATWAAIAVPNDPPPSTTTFSQPKKKKEKKNLSVVYHTTHKKRNQPNTINIISKFINTMSHYKDSYFHYFFKFNYSYNYNDSNRQCLLTGFFLSVAIEHTVMNAQCLTTWVRLPWRTGLFLKKYIRYTKKVSVKFSSFFKIIIIIWNKVWPYLCVGGRRCWPWSAKTWTSVRSSPRRPERFSGGLGSGQGRSRFPGPGLEEEKEKHLRNKEYTYCERWERWVLRGKCETWWEGD